MVYYSYITSSLQDLEHHGILGMKWGIRRYQNADGSLTEAGRKRYVGDDGYLNRSGTKAYLKEYSRELKDSNKQYKETKRKENKLNEIVKKGNEAKAKKIIERLSNDYTMVYDPWLGKYELEPKRLSYRPLLDD